MGMCPLKIRRVIRTLGILQKQNQNHFDSETDFYTTHPRPEIVFQKMFSVLCLNI
jgi:hypothetical protein